MDLWIFILIIIYLFIVYYLFIDEFNYKSILLALYNLFTYYFKNI